MRFLGRGADEDHGVVFLYRVQRHNVFGVFHLGETMTAVLPFALARRWLALVDSTLRRGAMASDIRDLDPVSFALFLRYLLDHRDRDDLRVLYLDAVVVVLESEAVSRDTRRDLVGRLGHDPYWPVFAFLSDASDSHPPALSPERPYDFEEVPVGVRKARARQRDRDTLVRMAADPDPSVIRILLENPAVTEDHALRVASLRPQTRSNFLEVLRSRFGVRERVQAALVLNPFCPVRLAVAITPLLTRSHLAEVLDSPPLDPRVRDAARVCLEQGR